MCGATKRDGTPCRKPPMANGRCRLHGGATPGGIACANYKHGRYSRFVPRGLKRGYEAARADTELASLREELALQQAMMSELLKQMEKSPAPPWAQAALLYREARAAKDVAVKAAKLTELGALLQAGAAAGAGHERARRELRELIQEKTKTAAAEARRLGDMGQTLTREQAMVLMHMVLTAIKDNVRDGLTAAQMLRGVQRDLRAILDRRAGGGCE
jgi:hypothetical protein